MNLIVTTSRPIYDFATEVFGKGKLQRYLGSATKTLGPGDRVIGRLPVEAIARVTEAGAEYWHLSLPGGMRGHYWHLDELRESAGFTRYTVQAGGSR